MKIRRTVMAAALLALLAVAAVVVAGAASPGASQARGRRPGRAHGHRQRPDQDLHHGRAPGAASLRAAGSASSTAPARVYPPETVTGVKLDDVLASIGGMTTLNACDVTASDNYGMTYTYDQVVNKNGVQLYNATTKEAEDAKAPWTFAIVWEQNGAPLPGDVGPLRLVVAPGDQRQPGRRRPPHGQVGRARSPCAGRSPSGRSRCSASSARTARARRTPWTASPTTRAPLPAATGSRGSTPPPRKTWSGVPLFLCVGKVDGGAGHDSYGAYNEALALLGVPRQAGRGQRQVRHRRFADHPQPHQHPARQQDDGHLTLTARYYPLRLVGPVKYVPRQQVHRPDQQDLPAAQVSRSAFAWRVRP